jgi:hypothetical protein
MRGKEITRWMEGNARLPLGLTGIGYFARYASDHEHGKEKRVVVIEQGVRLACGWLVKVG